MAVPFRDKTVSGLLCIAALHHLASEERRPGKCFLFSTLSKNLSCGFAVQDMKRHHLYSTLSKTLSCAFDVQVYEEIAGHFSETRHKPWPRVTQFISTIPVCLETFDMLYLHSFNCFQIRMEVSCLTWVVAMANTWGRARKARPGLKWGATTATTCWQLSGREATRLSGEH